MWVKTWMRASHLPGQRCAYPLLTHAPGACVDASLSRHLSLENTPDELSNRPARQRTRDFLARVVRH